MTHGTFGRLTRGDRNEMDGLPLAVDTIHADAGLLWKEQPREHGCTPYRQRQPAQGPVNSQCGPSKAKRRRAEFPEHFSLGLGEFIERRHAIAREAVKGHSERKPLAT